METMSIEQLGATAKLMATPIFLAFVGMVVLLSDLIFNREDERRWPAYLTVAGLIGSLFLWVQSWLLFHPVADDNIVFGTIRGWIGVGTLPDADIAQARSLFGGMFNAVGLAETQLGAATDSTLLATLMIIVATLIVTLLSPAHLERRGIMRGEFYALMIFAAVGGILMAGSANLIMLFLGLEMLSIPLYILAGFARPNLRSQEAALKYFLLGAFASGFLLYGIALTYGATGTMSIPQLFLTLATDISQMQQAGGVAQIAFVNGQPNLMLFAGLTMLLVGLFFKISLVPFHQWTPDVYEGAPTPVTAFMVTVTKIAGFAVLLNVLFGFFFLQVWWVPLLSIISVLTMVIGNIGALRQTNIKRMLAYSSIAHAGYMMVGVVGFGRTLLLEPIMFYLLVYTLTNLGAFAVLMALEEVTGKERVELEDFKGLGRTQPFLGLLMGFFLLSLAGFPPTAGFFAKFYLFSGSLIADQLWLIVIAVLLSVISLVYYARYLIAMFMESADTAVPAIPEGEVVVLADTDADAPLDDQPTVPPTPAPSGMRPAVLMVQTALVVTTVAMIVMALFPGSLLGLF